MELRVDLGRGERFGETALSVLGAERGPAPADHLRVPVFTSRVGVQQRPPVPLPPLPAGPIAFDSDGVVADDHGLMGVGRLVQSRLFLFARVDPQQTRADLLLAMVRLESVFDWRRVFH